MSLTARRRWLATAVLMTLAYLATREYVTLFLGVDFIFGSIFTFLAFQWLGLGSAMLVALAAGAYTVVHWGHPYALLTLAAECFFVGVALRRRPERNLPSWVLFFWVTIGLWAVLLSYRYLLDLPWTSAALAAFKQTANELCSAVLATLGFQAYSLLRRSRKDGVEPVAVRHLINNLLTFFAILPALAVLVLSSRSAVSGTEKLVQAEIEARQRSIAAEVISWQEAMIRRLDVLSRKGASINQQDLTLFSALNPELIFVHLLDGAGKIRLSTDEDKARLKAINFSDRPWFREMTATRRPVVSDVLIGRTSGQVAVALAVPIIDHGRLAGALLTSVSGKSALGRIAPSSSLQGDRITLLDRQHRVIASTETTFEPGKSLELLRQGVRSDGHGAAYRLQPNVMSSAMQLWLESYWVVESDAAARGAMRGWSLVAERPLRPYATGVQDGNLQSLAFMLALAIATMTLASVSGGLIAQPFQSLAQAMRDFAKTIGQATYVPELPRGGVQEIRDLSEVFNSMAREVTGSYEKLRRGRDELEMRVAQRTYELQQRQQALDEHAIVSITDASGAIIYVNEKFTAISGYTKEELLGQNHRLLNSGYHEARFFEDMWSTISRGRSWHGQICNRSKQGDFYWVASTIVPFVDANGLPTQYISIRTDITLVKDHEVELIAAREDAERASNAKSEFLSSMSHELRTPLNAVLGFAQLLNFDESLSDESKDGVQEILKAGEHLLALINEVLDLAKIESGHMDLSLEPVVVGPVITESCDLLEKLASTHDVRLHRGSHSTLTVRADRVRLKQVVLNLISNAIKYNRPGGTVAVDLLQPEFGRVWIRVTDTGHGIAPERLKELFQPFSRLGAENGPVEGTGIGLTITQRLVELMGGSVGVESRLGEGSTFWVDLPEESLETPAVPGAALVAEAVAQSRQSHTHTILYIEDNPANLKLVTQILAKRPHIHLLTAHAPRLGIDIARTRRPDLILLDINMPDMDGYEVLEVIRKDAVLVQLPVIAVTANAAPKDIRRGLDAGFNDYVVKPIDIAKLLAVVDQHLFKDEQS